MMAQTEGPRTEVLEKKRVLMEEVTKSTAICTSRQVPVITETCSFPLKEDSSKELLISIIDERRCKLSKPVPSKPQIICKVPQLLREDEKSAKSFDPEVVAIGPYHRDKNRLCAAEDHKRTAAAKFTSGCCISEFYQKIKNVADEAKECYADDAVKKLTDQDFIHMLFFDGCFVLHFIDCYAKDKLGEVPMSTHLHGFIVRDMFLLENQLPFVVLKELMSLKSVNLEEFFTKIIGTGFNTSSSSTRTPYHLLDLLRTKFLGAGPSDVRRQPGLEDLHVFRSVKELREVGIKFHKSKSRHLTDIKFVRCIVWGTLSLPMMVIDDQTRSQLLNMIALEMCPGYVNDYGITSFVWFLDCLIDRAEDVRELREEGILLNALGSDKQVAELFNELATNLAPDFTAYGSVLQEISKHRKNKFNVSIYRFLQTHFSSPWTTIAFVAAAFLLVLSVIQTYFAVFPRS